jgi:hypothetical protein
MASWTTFEEIEAYIAYLQRCAKEGVPGKDMNNSAT